jgi:hypothetical protein
MMKYAKESSVSPTTMDMTEKQDTGRLQELGIVD